MSAQAWRGIVLALAFEFLIAYALVASGAI